MKEQLIQYVKLLFAGAPDAAEIQQEILQNTLDRYDDLIAQGKSPEAAYRLSISGIGDIHEILKASVPSPAAESQIPVPEPQPERSRLWRAAAIALYILCPIPLFLLSEVNMDTLGLCCTLAIVAGATVLLLMARPRSQEKEESQEKPKDPLRKSIHHALDAITLAVYLILSFSTKAWYITWVLFPIVGCAEGLIDAFLDLKEANSREN